MTWIAVVMSTIAMLDSVVTKILNFLASDREKARATALALDQHKIAEKAAIVETKVDRNTLDTARVSQETRICQDAHNQCKNELEAVKAQLTTALTEQRSRIEATEKTVVAVAAAMPAAQLIPSSSVV